MARPWWTYGLWIVAAGAIGLVVSALFSSVLHLSRKWLLLPYAVMVSAFLSGYVRWSGTDIGEYLRHRWRVALVASVFVTTAYHWGYTEFRGPALMQPLIGNTLITMGYLLTMNPTTPVVAHIAMHVVAILHGMETTVHLPPHS